MSGFNITNLRRDTAGVWRANLTAGDDCYPADREFGSWQMVVAERRFDVLPHIAAELQRRVRRVERSESRAA